MANMKKEYKMSAERKEELQKELTYLKTVREKEVADLIKEARGFGDLSENSEYDEAKNEQGKLYSRIADPAAHRHRRRKRRGHERHQHRLPCDRAGCEVRPRAARV